MSTILSLVIVALVLAVAAGVVYALFEMSPFATHADEFRDPRTGQRRGESPHLE